MNWSSEWNSVNGGYGKFGNDTDKPSNLIYPKDVVIGPTHDGNVWTHPVTLFIPIEGEWPRPVEAIHVGDLAVHEDLKFEGKFWQVTHVPTLTRFNVVPPGVHDKAALIEWCKKVQGELLDDWKELAKLDHSCYKERHGFKDRIMNLCQNTEVK